MYGLTKTWKNEITTFAELGRVNSIGPGWVFTDMAEKTLQDKQDVKKILQTIPIQKIATANDVANMILFLLSDAVSGHISGESILISGGMEGRVLVDESDVDLSFFDKITKV